MRSLTALDLVLIRYLFMVLSPEHKRQFIRDILALYTANPVKNEAALDITDELYPEVAEPPDAPLSAYVSAEEMLA